MSVIEVKQKWLSAISQKDFSKMQERALRRAKREAGATDVRATTVLEEERGVIATLFGMSPKQSIVDDVSALTKDEWKKANVRSVITDDNGAEVGQVRHDKERSTRAEFVMNDDADVAMPQPVVKEPREPELLRDPELREPMPRAFIEPQKREITVSKPAIQQFHVPSRTEYKFERPETSNINAPVQSTEPVSSRPESSSREFLMPNLADKEAKPMKTTMPQIMSAEKIQETVAAVAPMQHTSSASSYAAELESSADHTSALGQMKVVMPVFFNTAAANINTPQNDDGAATHDLAAVHSIDADGSATRSSFRDAVVMDAEEVRAEIVASQNRTADIVAPVAA